MKYKNRSIQISCDGGAATGKTTGAKLIAKKYGLSFLSSGLLYRYSSYLILKYRPKNKILFLKKKFKNLNYRKLNKINLHTPKISSHSAEIAKILKIRNILKNTQKRFVMRCKICKKVVRTANKPSRTRLVCGICLRSTKKLLKTSPLVVING